MGRDTPNCPRCRTNINVIKMFVGFRCAFCGTKFYGKEEGGQQKLNI